MAAIILLLGLMAQIVTPAETTCLGFISDATLPMSVFIAGMEEEGSASMAAGNGLVYLNGPGVPDLKTDGTYRVVRPEGVVKDPDRGEPIGIYYKQLGTVRIVSEGKEFATAIVMLSCQPMIKGDILLPWVPKPPLSFSGKVSDRLTPYTENSIESRIILGKDDLRELSSGQFCFIGVGSRDRVQIGDRFTVYRLQPLFDPHDLSVAGTRMDASYEKMEATQSRSIADKLGTRKLPPRPIGDLVVVDVAEKTAVSKIINSLSEIHLGDIVVKR
jgi:hypothetical protein